MTEVTEPASRLSLATFPCPAGRGAIFRRAFSGSDPALALCPSWSVRDLHGAGLLLPCLWSALVGHGLLSVDFKLSFCCRWAISILAHCEELARVRWRAAREAAEGTLDQASQME